MTVGIQGDPVAELIKLGWVGVSPGNSNVVCTLLFSKISLHRYKNLCSPDCLGREEYVKSDDLVYDSGVWRIIKRQIWPGRKVIPY